MTDPLSSGLRSLVAHAHPLRARMRRSVGLLPGVPAAAPLRGRRVLVTGASSGIGEETAVLAGAEGAHVILVARRTEELERVADRVRSTGGSASIHQADLADPDSVDALADWVIVEHGGTDYLINNAGRSIRRSLELSHDRMHDFERTMAVNYFGPVRLTMALLPAMRQQQFGHVVNILSWGIQLKAPKFAAYLASKSALDTWARIAARETLADNVTFTNMRFGMVRTPMVVPSGSAEDLRALTAEQAAAKVIRACEDRPANVDTATGAVGELLNAVMPLTMDRAMHRMHARSPDTAQARGQR